eukprot:CAMPEP_0206631858 /NCGR_PEP_ID=MMETSP0325_2-20121206/68529_1 /ASSEMBLY_ACC=CAM_ASM_000347 /TAXON_ID=2866 /ORGANISM="Crypthecodinium cohnii, Strain Seligo" /LENGTH=35 /DNA_ID= /DNA_START= /DNA_END= /DNA_ORIENTATION=
MMTPTLSLKSFFPSASANARAATGSEQENQNIASR